MQLLTEALLNNQRLNAVGCDYCKPVCARCILPAGHRLLTHFEVSGLQCRACEQSGEDHVQRDRKASTNVPISDLNILNLCGITCIAFCTPWGKRKTPQGQDTMTPKQTGRQTFPELGSITFAHCSSLFFRARPSFPPCHCSLPQTSPRLAQVWEPNAPISIPMIVCKWGL